MSLLHAVRSLLGQVTHVRPVAAIVANKPLRKRTIIADRRSADSPKSSPQSMLAAKPTRRTGLRPNKSERTLRKQREAGEEEGEEGGFRVHLTSSLSALPQCTYCIHLRH